MRPPPPASNRRWRCSATSVPVRPGPNPQRPRRLAAGDWRHPAAGASHRQALALFRDLGNLLGQAEALNRLGELAIRTADTPQARKHHTQALAIARDLSAAPEEARALDGLGHSHLHDGNPGQASAHLQQALAIYQRIGAPAARRVQQTMENHRLTSTTRPSSQQI